MITQITSIPLFRADKWQPPDSWDSTFKSYTYRDGNKNICDAFFFSSAEEDAKGFYPELPSYFLTHCIVSQISVLDLSNCTSVYAILDLLESHKILERIKDFKVYDTIDQSRSPTFEQAFFENYKKAKATLVNDPNDMLGFFRHSNRLSFKNKEGGEIKDNQVNVGLFGQRLTDFENGTHFKSILNELTLDGYSWREGFSPIGLTYCLFSSEKLSKPTCTEIFREQSEA